MYKGTTPTHTFTTDVDLSTATVLYITYQQGGSTVLEKTLTDVTITPTSVSVELTQAETLAFDETDISVQIRAKFSDGTAIASNITKIQVGQILKKGEI